MNIRERIDELMKLHDAYAKVRFDDKHYHVIELIEMYHGWHSKSATLFSQYISSTDSDLLRFNSAKNGNAYVLASVFSELETPFQILVDKLKRSPFCKLECLIDEGKAIVDGIRYQVPPSDVIRLYSVYRLSDESTFQTWKNRCLRLIEVHFKQGNALDDFKAAIQSFEKSCNNPIHMHDMIGILKSLSEIQTAFEFPTEASRPVSPVTVNVVQNQSQNQNQTIAIFLDSIKDELTGKQLRELREIIEEESDQAKAKTKIWDKVKSFGVDVLSNIVTNLITNPNIWSSLG